jgi:hypothetical protein
VRHCGVDVIPGPIIGTAHKPDAVIIEEDDVTIAVATKDHSRASPLRLDWFPLSALFLGELRTLLR